jgi:glyoxylase-like metal-dependent hydrolase (beta-lactamase superfamily II)
VRDKLLNTKDIVSLGHEIYQVELVSDETDARSAGYFINSDKKTVVEMGASVSVPCVLSALDKLGVAYQEVTYVIVTHIHLDHAGGAGLLLEKLPNAKIIIHPKGAKHLVDPSKLIASAKQVYGEAFESLFAPIVPIPAERVIIAGDGMEIEIGPNRTLLFMDSPGHAYHHYAVYDPQSQGLFSGDAAGISFPKLQKEFGFDFYVPSSSPTQFDPEAMLATLHKFLKLDLTQLFITHYGRHSDARQVIEKNIERTAAYAHIAREAFAEEPTWEHTAARLRKFFHYELEKMGVPQNHPVLQAFEFDIEMNAKGMFHYIQTKVHS